MKLPPTTILVLFVKNMDHYPHYKVCVDWAVDMLMAGFETPNLIQLAGEFAPFDYIEIEDLTTKIFQELNIDYTNRDEIIKNHTHYWIEKALSGEIEDFVVLEKLAGVFQETSLSEYGHFQYLFWERQDVIEYGSPFLVKNEAEMTQMIRDYFITWQAENSI